MSGQPAIQASAVHKSFGAVKALDGLDLAVEKGSVLGLLGPNGAGKTTIVKIISTLLKNFSGEVLVDGINVAREPKRVREVIGLAGQDPAVDQWHTGFENLVMVGQLFHMSKSAARARATEILENLDLAEAADRIVRGYSGGMRRRLDIGAALVARPKILILDEPTTGLDPKARIELWEVIRTLVKSGTTLLLTTQYLEEADALADSIVVIDQGRVIAEGTPAQLKAKLGQDVLELTVAGEDQAAQAKELLEGLGSESPRAHERTITVPVLEGSASLFEAVRRLDSANVEILNLSLRQPSLDEVFLALTGNAAGGQGTETQGNRS